MSRTQREGVLVTPHRRLTDEQIKLIDALSRDLLEEPGLLCYNAAAADIFRAAGAKIEDAEGCVLVRLPSSIIEKALETAPAKIVLGARNPSNRLILDAHEPRVRFGSGSETNIWLDVQFDGTMPRFNRVPGSSWMPTSPGCGSGVGQRRTFGWTSNSTAPCRHSRASPALSSDCATRPISARTWITSTSSFAT